MEGLEKFNFSVAKLLVEDIKIAQDLMLTHDLLFCCNLCKDQSIRMKARVQVPVTIFSIGHFSPTFSDFCWVQMSAQNFKYV
jgi:hypothetical protein